MKHLFYIMLLLPLAFGACSSGDDAVVTPNKPDPDVPVEPEKPDTKDEIKILGTLNVFMDEGDKAQTLTITANCAWTTSVADAWCHLSKTEGKAGEHTLEISVDRNTDYDERETEIGFKSAGGAEARIAVVQKQHDALMMTPSKQRVPAAGAEITVVVKSNINYTIDIAKNAAMWISLVETRSLKEETVVFKIAANENPALRQGKVTFRSGSLSETLVVEQEAAEKPDPEVAGKQRIRIVHTSQVMPAPELIGKEGFNATVFWDSVSSETYNPTLVHNYPDAGPYELIVRGDDLDIVTVKKLNKVQVIDLSKF